MAGSKSDLPTLAEIEVMIAVAEAELATLKLRLLREKRVFNPLDPLDPVGCLELWLDALRNRRRDLLRGAGVKPSGASRLH